MKIHLDLDCYFVSCERVRHKELKEKNVVVVKASDKKIFSYEKKNGVIGDGEGAFNSILEFENNYEGNIFQDWKKEFIEPNGKIRGIVIAKSYEAKKFGIKTGTPLREALCLCPNLYVLPSDHLYYQQVSQELKSYLHTQIPLIEQYSIDEFFGDLRGWIEQRDTEEFIKHLQSEIKRRFDLPITIGASRSKWIAKLATDKAKPFGVRIVEDVESFVDEIAIKDFPGIGRALQKKLENHGVYTIKDAKKKKSFFDGLGKVGKNLYQRFYGCDNDAVVSHRDRRGIGISRNFEPIACRKEISRRVQILIRYLSHTLTKLELNPTTFYLKIRYEGSIKSKKSITIQRRFSEYLLLQVIKDIFCQIDILPHHKIHYISLYASNFVGKFHNFKTFELLENAQDAKMTKLSNSLLKLRDKYGVDVVRWNL